MLLTDVTSSVLSTALSGLSMRQRAIANNIANVETPQYRAQRVLFEDNLRAAVENGTPGDAQPSIATSLEPTRLDGNNVNLDHETIGNVDTGLRYQLMLRAMDDQFGLLHVAIKGGA